MGAALQSTRDNIAKTQLGHLNFQHPFGQGV
jgi:hypothetical protein